MTFTTTTQVAGRSVGMSGNAGLDAPSPYDPPAGTKSADRIVAFSGSVTDSVLKEHVRGWTALAKESSESTKYKKNKNDFGKAMINVVPSILQEFRL